jgi:hypothetical protein
MTYRLEGIPTNKCLACSFPEEIAQRKERFKGSSNPRFGKPGTMKGRNPYDLWVEKYGTEEADRRKSELNSKQGRPHTKDWKEDHSRKMTESNSMAGRSIYSVWLENYGKEEADCRMIASRAKWSLASSGSNNPMFGKPSPIGSGCGWSGWYRGHYFRSLLELSYMLKFDEEGTVWESAEKKYHKIPYQTSTGSKNFFPDFYLPLTEEFVEIKPRALTYTEGNKAKFAAAKNLLGDKFKVLTEDNIHKIQGDQLSRLVSSGTVKLLPKWQNRLSIS